MCVFFFSPVYVRLTCTWKISTIINHHIIMNMFSNCTCFLLMYLRMHTNKCMLFGFQWAGWSTSKNIVIVIRHYKTQGENLACTTKSHHCLYFCKDTFLWQRVLVGYRHSPLKCWSSKKIFASSRSSYFLLYRLKWSQKYSHNMCYICI